MSIGALDAMTAYGRALGVGAEQGIGGLGETAAAATPKGAGGFGTMVESLVSTTAAALRTAESAGVKQVAGKGDLIDVVTAMGAAETALDTVVAVRDRMVSAYSEIMRLQI